MAKKMVVSPRFKLVKEDLIKVARGAALAALSAISLYIADYMQTIELGEGWYTPIIVALIPVFANLLRKFATENKYK